jgi:pimeloyl-ACP methyl ester carboxylesterase
LANPNNQLSDYQTSGLILIGTAVRPIPNNPSFFPDGGLPIFYLPVWLLQCLQYYMTLQFTKMAIHPKHNWLRQACMADSNANSCFMIRSFYRQTKWATMDDLRTTAVSTAAVFPVLVIHGVDDGVIPLKYAQDLVNAVPKGSLCAVDEASHLVMIEQADKVASLTLDYLNEYFLK